MISPSFKDASKQSDLNEHDEYQSPSGTTFHRPNRETQLQHHQAKLKREAARTAKTQVMPTMLVIVASLEGTVEEVAPAEVRLLSVAEGEPVSEAEADFQEVLKSDEAVTAETTSDEVTAVVMRLASVEVPLTEMMVEVTDSMTELMVAGGTPSVADWKEVDSPLSLMALTGPTGVGRALSVAELIMPEAVMVLMEVLKTPAVEPTELPQSVTVTVTVTASCEVAMAPMAAECTSVEL